MASTNESQQEQNTPQSSQSDKELNFRALQAKYEKKLEEERQARLELEKRIAQSQETEDDDSDEPYVDHKRLNKKLSKVAQSTQSDIQKAMQIAKEQAKIELRDEMWKETHPDFHDTMQMAQKFAETAPEMAEAILKMNDSFERQKLVYHAIKKLDLDKPEKKPPSIQEKIDANRRSPYYQPSGVGTAPYASQGDFSSNGQKNAYDKLQELKKNLRLG